MFGGGYESKVMHKFSLEGDMVEDMSDDPLIPTLMCQRSFDVQGWELYAVGEREVNSEWEWGVQVFDG